MNDGPLFMHLLQIHLNDLLDSNSYSIALIKQEIGLVKEDVEVKKSFFTNIDQEFYKYLRARILDVAYEAKDVIDSIIVRDNGLIHFFFSLPLTIKKIKLIKEDVSNISEKIPKNKRLNIVNSPKKPVESKSLMGGKIIVGFKEETNWLIRKITSGPASLDVISITGMPGSGKTTLAYKDATTWDDLTRPFPEVEKGSRIILTTQQKEVAFHGRGNTDPLNLRLLSPEESWKLLEKRKFGEQSCPDELLDVGKEIAENCKVLSLVADLIAGVIAGLEKKKAVWLEVRNNLNYFIFNSEVDVMKVIELSYDHLSHHMKPCFLYLASFPKDKAIQFDALEIYWRAEGLAEQTEVLQVYFDKLITSSLAIIFNEIGNRPTLQIHDLVHDFCLIKAREEKLFEQISSSDASACLDLMPRIVTINYDKEHFGPNNFILLDSKMERHSGQHLYSLYIMGDKMEDRLSDACHLRELRLLRLLHLDPSFVMVKDSLLNEIGVLNHLRF
ncbi:hypothetical protein CQW23_13800 [Capsicum baccatum]|uniref:NB-ARC domain-containing protein n=1 Tax=Capsicum baccatum TaxID=33114 RepID=A0A2G2WHE1_CAPBA|nr:hypothetical protein CQW23_13800 [Capsicum baccatum]